MILVTNPLLESHSDHTISVSQEPIPDKPRCNRPKLGILTPHFLNLYFVHTNPLARLHKIILFRYPIVFYLKCSLKVPKVLPNEFVTKGAKSLKQVEVLCKITKQNKLI